LRAELSIIKILVIFCAIAIALILVLFFLLPFDLPKIGIKTEQQRSSAQCWEKIKEEKCDVYQPTSRARKELLDCSTGEPKIDKNLLNLKCEWMELFCIAGIFLVILNRRGFLQQIRRIRIRL
jgi:hypothetical protein